MPSPALSQPPLAQAEPKLIFASSVEGLYVHGLGGVLTPALKGELRRRGLDLDRRLLPAYPVEVLEACTELLITTVFSDLPRERAYFRIGELSVEGFANTRLGKATVSLMRLYSTKRYLERLTHSMRAGCSYMETSFQEKAPGDYEVWISDVGRSEHVMRGTLTAAMKLMGHTSATVEFVARAGEGGRFRICEKASTQPGRQLPEAVLIPVGSDADVLVVQSRCQALCKDYFGLTDCVKLATAASELARNIYMYAGRGEVRLALTEEGRGVGLSLVASDQGPGIANLEQVLAGSYVSRTGLGRGLAGSRKLFDRMEIESAPGRGTVVRGWKQGRVRG